MSDYDYPFGAVASASPDGYEPPSIEQPTLQPQPAPARTRRLSLAMFWLVALLALVVGATFSATVGYLVWKRPADEQLAALEQRVQELRSDNTKLQFDVTTEHSQAVSCTRATTAATDLADEWSSYVTDFQKLFDVTSVSEFKQQYRGLLARRDHLLSEQGRVDALEQLCRGNAADVKAV